MTLKHRIRVYPYKFRRKGVTYNYKVHYNSDGSSRWERLGRSAPRSSGPARRRPETVLDRRKSKKAGDKHEDKVLRFVREAAGDRLVVFSKWPVIGSAGEWEADITINGPGDFDSKTKTGTIGPLMAVVECKFSSLGVAGGSYSNGVERAYALLNYVKRERERTKLFLVMNRLPETGETPRDPRVLFDKMGARFIDFGNETDRAVLHREIVKLHHE